MDELVQLLKKSRASLRDNPEVYEPLNGKVAKPRRRQHPNKTPNASHQCKDAGETPDAAPPNRPIITTIKTPLVREYLRKVGAEDIQIHNVEAVSTTITAMWFDPKTKVLAVLFKKNQGLYHYPDFTLAAYKKLLKAESIGKALKALRLTRFTRIQ